MLLGAAERGAVFTEPVSLAINVDDRARMEEAAEDRGGQPVCTGA